jgi:transposase
MPWNRTTRGKYQGFGRRFASDMTDAEWQRLEPLLPAPHRRGRPRKRSLRVIVEAILYMAWTGIQWRALPAEFPPFTTVQNYFYAWRNSGFLGRIVDVLVRQARRALGCAEAPTAAIIDSQSAPTSQGGPRGYDAGKRIHGRKRHIVTDTNGLLLVAHVHPANIQDNHGAVPLLKELRQTHPTVHHVFADRVYRGPKLLRALAPGPWTIEIVKRPTGIKGFQLLPRRWVVERTFAWFAGSRRLARDFERSPQSEVAWIFIAHLRILIKRLADDKTPQTNF